MAKTADQMKVNRWFLNEGISVQVDDDAPDHQRIQIVHGDHTVFLDTVAATCLAIALIAATDATGEGGES